ncbi:MAG: 30S ribosomal protein S6 [Thermodesulfobacteriota bacterium]
MRRYETIAILDPDLSEDGRAPVFDRLTQLIPTQNGFLVKLDEWGARRLAYDIKKKSRGYYICIDLCGDGAVVNEMERFFRIDDRVLKYMTVVLDKDVDLEAIKAEIAEAEAEAKAKAEADAQAKAEAEAKAKAEAEAAAAAATAEAEKKAEETPEEAPAAEAETPETSDPETVEETTDPIASKEEE